jgi:hypothetical protein
VAGESRAAPCVTLVWIDLPEAGHRQRPGAASGWQQRRAFGAARISSTASDIPAASPFSVQPSPAIKAQLRSRAKWTRFCGRLVLWCSLRACRRAPASLLLKPNGTVSRNCDPAGVPAAYSSRDRASQRSTSPGGHPCKSGRYWGARITRPDHTARPSLRGRRCPKGQVRAVAMLVTRATLPPAAAWGDRPHPALGPPECASGRRYFSRRAHPSRARCFDGAGRDAGSAPLPCWMALISAACSRGVNR